MTIVGASTVNWAVTRLLGQATATSCAPGTAVVGTVKSIVALSVAGSVRTPSVPPSGGRDSPSHWNNSVRDDRMFSWRAGAFAHALTPVRVPVKWVAG